MAGASQAVEQVRTQVQAVAAGNGEGATVFDLIKRQQPAIELALPSHLSGERFTRIAMTLVRTTPKLLECEPMSFIGALMVSAQLGLEPGPPLGLSWIIPRKNRSTGKQEANFQIGYKGVRELFSRSGQYKSLQARPVHRNDEFDYAYGLEPHLTHKPILEGDRGPAYAWYAVAQFKDGGNAFVVLSRDDVEARRKRGQDGPAWRTDYNAMACKSAIMALAPWLPLSAELERALAADGRTFTQVQPNMADLPMIEAGSGDVDAPEDDIADAELVTEYAKGEEPFE